MLEILADIHERDSKIAEELRRAGWTVEERELEAGDYVLGWTIGIERKTTSDLVNSMVRGRLFAQLARLQQSVLRRVLIIEGSQEPLDRLHAHALEGLLVSLAVKWSVPVLWTRDSAHTARTIHTMAVQLTRVGRAAPALKRTARRPCQENDASLAVLHQLPGIGSRGSLALLRAFGSVERVATASLEELRGVQGIGKRKAGLISETLRDRRGDND